MSGGTFAHSLISQRFVSAFEKRLDSKLWALTGHSRGVETAATVRYPDTLVESMGTDHHGLSTDAPVAIVEVLSPTTEQLDMNVKPAEYMSLPSLEAYIIASQNAPQGWVWLRDSARKFAEVPKEQSGLQATVEIGVLGISIPLVEIYSGISSLKHDRTPQACARAADDHRGVPRLHGHAAGGGTLGADRGSACFEPVFH
jgi:Uma2 family endonuclease